jgi:hypothetical protein
VSMLNSAGLLALLFVLGVRSQSIQVPKQHDKKPTPTLGLNRIKDVSPILDMDAYDEEKDMERRLPGNPFVKDKRIIHESSLLNEFLEGFQNSKECNGITFTLNEIGRPDFAVQVGVSGHDNHLDGESWTWLLVWPGDPSSLAKESHGMGGMGSQSSARLAARDVCLTIWDDLDPNHFKRPGGKIER